MIKQRVGWVARGIAMGIADAVPGVSGGTIALITGIYERFIAALASFNISLLAYLKRRQWLELWRAIDGEFLVCVGSGILISLFTTLALMSRLLDVAAPIVWAFFSGVILFSIIHFWRQKLWPLVDKFALFIGVLVAIGLSIATPTSVEPTAIVLAIGGMIAISAMMLPGISGSFMLVLLGLYQPVTDAVANRDVITILWVAFGCLLGVIFFSQFLQWLLKRWHDRVMSLMLGFVIGALIKVWPWQFEGRWLDPNEYALLSGQSHWLMPSLIAMVSGVTLVWYLTHRSKTVLGK